jgi:PTS system ascorbate-specific IIA component
MLKKILTEDLVALDVTGLTTPEDVIRYSGQLLVKAGKVQPSYVEKMLDAFHSLGPYIVMGPGIAMPHAHAEGDVSCPGISFVRLKEPVVFGHPENDPVVLVFALAGKAHDDHIDILQSLSELLGDEEKQKALTLVADYQELCKLF